MVHVHVLEESLAVAAAAAVPPASVSIPALAGLKECTHARQRIVACTKLC